MRKLAHFANVSPQEVKFWVEFEPKALGFCIRKQASIGRYIIDFVSYHARMVIEVDGGQYGMQEGVQSDRDRDAFLQSEGFCVLRFWNSDVDQNLNGVMERFCSY